MHMETIHKPDELIRMIEGYGFSLFVGDDGVVHGRAVVPGTKVPWEMRPLLEELQAMNEDVATIVRARTENRDVEVLMGLTQEEMQPWIQKVKAGEYRLCPGTQVAYRKSTGLTYLQLEKVKA